MARPEAHAATYPQSRCADNPEPGPHGPEFTHHDRGSRHGGQPTGRPRQAHLRAQRRLAQLYIELDVARTRSARIAAAADFVRGAVKHSDPYDAQEVTDELVRVLVDSGTRLLTGREDPRR